MFWRKKKCRYTPWQDDANDISIQWRFCNVCNKKEMREAFQKNKKTKSCKFTPWQDLGGFVDVQVRICTICSKREFFNCTAQTKFVKWGKPYGIEVLPEKAKANYWNKIKIKGEENG